MKHINGGALGTTTLVYRPLSAQSARSQSGAVGPGESSATAAYSNPCQHVDVPDGLVKHVLLGFMDVRRQLFDGKEKGEGHMTERGTLDLVEHLRLVLVRGAVELQEEFPENLLLKRFPFNSRNFLRGHLLHGTRSVNCAHQMSSHGSTTRRLLQLSVSSHV
ncbi:unnamed protein product [Ectocarpus sp. 12 AP-2014]